jgi:hypothetical protein
MENTKKIIFFLLLLLSLISCNSQDRKGFDLPNNLYKDSVGNIIFRVPAIPLNEHKKKGIYFKNDSINFTHVYNQKSNNYIKNNDIIDYETFKNIFSISDNVSKIKTNITSFEERYVKDTYYEDKNNLYIYNSFNEVFMKLEVKEYELLGGNYLKNSGDIYCNGEKIENVDIKTFKLIKVFKPDEGMFDIGIDKNHLYFRSGVMDYDIFKRFNWEELQKKEFTKKYFKDKK